MQADSIVLLPQENSEHSQSTDKQEVAVNPSSLTQIAKAGDSPQPSNQPQQIQ